MRRFVAEAPIGWRIASVDLAAEMKAIEFLRLAGHALGVSASSRLGKARLRLQDALADESAEGRRWLLVVNEAHRGRSGVWDEVQAIANQLGRPRGFAALFVVGERIWRALLVSRRSSIGLAAQIRRISISSQSISTKHASCSRPPVQWCRRRARARGSSPQLTRQPGRAAAPGPGMAAAPSLGAGRGLANRSNVRGIEQPRVRRPADPSDLDAEARPDLSHEVVKEQNGSTRSSAEGARARAEAPALIPSKPPIRDEEGLVEVGWEGDLEDELSAAERARATARACCPTIRRSNEELIEDRYAALQAVSERTERSAVDEQVSRRDTRGRICRSCRNRRQSAEPRRQDGLRELRTAPGGIRAEGQHEFAPYSQLFTRFRQSK